MQVPIQALLIAALLLGACGTDHVPLDFEVQVAIDGADAVVVSGTGCPPDPAWRNQGGHDHWYFPVVRMEPLQGPRDATTAGRVANPQPGGGYVSALLVLDVAPEPGGVVASGASNEDGTWSASLTRPAGAPSGEYIIRTTCITRDGLTLGTVTYEPAVIQLP